MAIGNTAAAKINTSGYLCSPSGQAPSSEAQAHMERFLSIVGEIQNDQDEGHNRHCPDCFVTIHGLQVQATFKTSIVRLSRNIDNYFALFNGFLFNSTGPPLGSRAPPSFQ